MMFRSSEFHRSLLLLFVSLLISAVHAGPASDVFLQAASYAETDLVRARELYVAAALKFLEEAQSSPGQAGLLYYNAGNAFFLGGNSGRAIAAYRRSERELPGHELLKQNLDFVRRQSVTYAKAESSMWDSVLFWHRWNRAFRLAVAAAGYMVFWAALMALQWTGIRQSRKVMMAAALVFVMLGGSLTVDHLQEKRIRRGVVIADQVTGRKGPNYGYASAFEGALTNGTECRIVGQERTWLQLELDSSRSCWVPAPTIEIWQGGKM